MEEIISDFLRPWTGFLEGINSYVLFLHAINGSSQKLNKNWKRKGTLTTLKRKTAILILFSLHARPTLSGKQLMNSSKALDTSMKRNYPRALALRFLMFTVMLLHAYREEYLSF